ncbi:hypothetical protein LB505_013986 [Fusarium chuoi]|nr:hypothetical protein LB505_013986 [Fusarium chuoi]
MHPLKTKVDSVIQHDIRKTDVVFQYTTVRLPNDFTTALTCLLQSDIMGYVGSEPHEPLLRCLNAFI